MDAHMTVRIVVGLLMTVVALAVAGRRVWFLQRMIRSGQPSPGRLDDVGTRLRAQVVEVFGQRKLLQWSVPGVAHFITFWAFIILGATIVEAFGALFDADFHIPLIGKWLVLGFLEDLMGVLLLVSLAVFAYLRVKNAPARLERGSRFYGSHTGAAWVILGMISLVVITLFGYRGPQINTGVFPFQDDKEWTFASNAVAKLLEPLGESANEVIETTFILLQLAVILGFLVLVTYSKHLHIFVAPINVSTKRLPMALGPALPMMSNGKPLDFEQADPEKDVFGIGKIEDVKWTGYLDFASCTECGRCQSQCPAWNTGKPLSPKLLIMNMRDHLFAKAPYILGSKTSPEDHVPNFHDAGTETGHHVPESGYERVMGSTPDQAARPLVGTAAEGGVIDPDVLWSCTTCGACVEQCPVDIEHVDHIIDMRRYQVLIESAFPSEAGVMLRNIENKGNPWGMNAAARTEWMDGLPFEVKTVSPGSAIPDDVDYLFWVGCAGALEDRSKKVSRAVAELLHTAGVSFVVLGREESCTGDPARRLGNEFLFQMQAQMNVEVLNSVSAKKIVTACPHCFNTIANEYPQVGGDYEVVHHTQLLASLVESGRLVPVTPVEGSITYHDPCYLGRHNKVYTPPREVLSAISGLRQTEMTRCKERGFCCGAGGARMWMEEKIGKRINVERTDEALGTGADLISTACPFCITMLSDAVTAKVQAGEAPEKTEVLDVSQILARSLVKAPALVGGGTPATGDRATPSKETAAAAVAAPGAPQAPGAPEATGQTGAAEPMTAGSDTPAMTATGQTGDAAAATPASDTPGAAAPGQTGDAGSATGASDTPAGTDPVEAAQASITPDALHEGSSPVGATPRETETADYVQLADAEDGGSGGQDGGEQPTTDPAAGVRFDPAADEKRD